MTTVLRGTHVTLRPLTVDDAERTLRWRLDDRAKLLNRGAETVEQQAAWIAARPASEINFVIELASGEAVGMLSLVGIDRVNRHAEPARFLIGEPKAVSHSSPRAASHGAASEPLRVSTSSSPVSTHRPGCRCLSC